jgi:hypothetical protein
MAGMSPAGAVARAGDTLVMSLPLDGRGPRAGRTAVEGLRGRIAPSVLEDATLVASELSQTPCVTAVCPGAGSCVELTGTTVRLEVTDPGDAGVSAPRAPDHEADTNGVALLQPLELGDDLAVNSGCSNPSTMS